MGAKDVINLRKESDWQFFTSAGGAGGAGSVLISSGMFVLTDPEEHNHKFHYGGAGVGWSYPLSKLPSRPTLALPKLTLHGHEIGATGATADFPSDGIVYVTEACHGADLTPQALVGGAIYFDGGFGWLRGYSGTLLIVGINPELLEIGVMFPPMLNLALSTATAVIFMKGQNEGLQESIGVDYMLGQVSYQGEYSDAN